MTQEELRQQAAISILNALLETTPHSVMESIAIKDVYAHVAVLYANSLVSALNKKDNEIMEWLNNQKK